MSKLFRSCTALLMALCLILGVCGTGVAASAVEMPDESQITKQDMVDWAKDILDRILETGISKEGVAAKLKSLVEEAKDILDRIEQIDLTKENAVAELKNLIGKAKDVLGRIKEVSLRDNVPAEEIKLLVGVAVVALDRVLDLELAEGLDMAKVKELVKEAKAALDRIADVEVRDEVTAANMEKLLKEVIAKTETKIAELETFVEEKKAELDAAIADADAQLEDAKAQVADAEQKIADAKVELADAKAELEDAKAKVAEKEEELKSAPIADKADLEAELADAKAELADAEQKIADAEQKIADAEEQIADAKVQIADAEAQRDAAVAEAEAAIAAIEKAIAAAKKAVNKVKPYADVVFDNAQPVLDQLFVLYDALVKLVNEGCNAAALDLQSALYDLAKATAEYVEKTTGKSSEVLEEKVVAIKNELNAMYIEATQTTLDCIDLTKIVALGDKNAYGVAADKFADRVSEFLGKQPEEYVNMTVADQTAAALRADLEKYADELSDATLITVSFNTNAFTKYAMDQAAKFAMGRKVSFDWSAYLGEDNADYIEEVKAELYAKLEEKGFDNIPSIMVVVESYAYAYAQHVLSYYPLIRDIHAMNPDAHIVMVGMHNSIEDVVAEVAGVEVPLGDFMRYLSDISNIYSLSYAMLSENKVFVNAYSIEIAEDEESFLKNAPSDAGHAEIADRIWNALNIQDHKWVLDDVTDEGEWHECDICHYRRFHAYEVPPVGPDESGDMIGVVVALLAVSGLGITVLKRRED